MLSLQHLQHLQRLARDQERKGNAVTLSIATTFPKNPPPPGIAYSKNFARVQQQGRFAVQVRD